MAVSPFLQVSDNSKTFGPVIANTFSSLVISGINTTSFPAVNNGYIVTIWDETLYPDPGDDPNMEKAKVTAATIGVTGSFTLTRANPKIHLINPRIALLVISQQISDLNTAVNTLEAGGASSTYTNATPTPSTLGGIASGSTFSGATVQQVFDALLYPYQLPSFSAFSITGQSTPIEVGTAVSGSKTFAWTSANSSNVNSTSVAITGPNSLSDTGNAASGSKALNVGTNLLSAPGSVVWTITGTNSNGQQFTRTYTVSWQLRIYFGTSANTTLTSAQILALAGSQLGASATGNYALAAANYKYIIVPASLTAPSSFTDTSTNLSVTMADSTDNAAFSNTANGLSYALVNVTNSQGIVVSCRVYRTKYTLGGSITIGVA